MKKSNNPQTKQRQRQKVSRKIIIIIGACSLLFIVIGLTIFFNISHVDQTDASDNHLIIDDEQTFTIEKTIEAPVIAQRPTMNSNTVFAKKVKVQTAQTSHQ